MIDFWTADYSLYVIAKTLLISFPILIIILFFIFLKVKKIAKKNDVDKETLKESWDKFSKGN